ncbi:hypothetical protein PMAYCL1PPCAC_09010, partial [Pristionchus mayeri]
MECDWTITCVSTTIPPTTKPTTAATTKPATTTAPTCPPDGVWSEWVTTGTCPTTCGAYSTLPRKRTCTTLCGNCPCKCVSEDVGPCGLALCSFPNKTCKAPYVKSINGTT